MQLINFGTNEFGNSTKTMLLQFQFLFVTLFVVLSTVILYKITLLCYFTVEMLGAHVTQLKILTAFYLIILKHYFISYIARENNSLNWITILLNAIHGNNFWGNFCSRKVLVNKDLDLYDHVKMIISHDFLYK